MLQCDVNSLEELEEIEYLEAETVADQSNNNPPSYISCDFLVDMNFLFDLQMSAYLRALLASQGSDNRTLLVSSSSQLGSSQVSMYSLNIGILPI